MSAARGQMGRVRRALATGFALQLRAARNESISVIAAQVIDAATLAGQLFVIRRVLVMIGVTPGRGFAVFVPWLVGLGVMYTVRAVCRSFIRERQEVIGELVQREVTLRVAEAASTADVADYDDPDFHDRLRRVRTQTYQHAWSMVWAIMNGSSELLVALSMVVVLITVAPITLAVGVAAIVPFVLVNRLRNRLGYRWTVEQTVRDPRADLSGGTARPAHRRARAAVIGARAAPDATDPTFYDLRIADVRAVSRRRLRAAIAGSVVASLIAVVSLAVLVSAAVSGRLSVAEVGVAVIALQQLTNQLRGAVDVFGEIDAAVPFLEDFSAFERTIRPPGACRCPGRRAAADPRA